VEATAIRNNLSKIGFAAFLAVLIAIAAVYLYNIVRWANGPDFGFGFRAGTGIWVVGVVRDHAQKAGMGVGDSILKVNGKSFTSIDELRAAMRRKVGETNTYLLEGVGGKKEVTITNIPVGLKRSFLKSGLCYLLGLCYAIIGTLVFLMKPHQRASWIFYGFSGTVGLWLIFLYKGGPISPYWLETVHILAFTCTPAVFVHLALCLPEERIFLKKRPYAQIIPYLFSIFLFLWIRLQAPTIMDTPDAPLVIVMVLTVLSISMFLGSCLQLWRGSTSQLVKIRAKMILLGFAISASVPLMDFVSSVIFHRYILPSYNYYLPFFLVFPAFVGYSIVKHDLFDIDAIIKRTYGYVLTTGALAGIYGLLVLISNLLFGQYEITKSRIFPLAFILIVVFLFNPVRDRVQRIIDRLFYRLEYDYQETVEKISETMRSLLKLDEIGKSMLQFAMQPMFVDTGSIMLLNPDKRVYEPRIAEGKKDVMNHGTGKDLLKPETPETSENGAMLSNHILPADNPLMAKMAEQKKELTIYDIQENPFFKTERDTCFHTFEELDATLIVPLIYEDRLDGILTLGRKKSGKFYQREDINLLKTLANQGVVAIENALMIEEVIEKERMQEELNIARDLQTSMLPATCPKIEGFEIAAFSVSAREVGGDFYDFIEMDDGLAGMVIGDVTGKSVSGALVMSASRSVFRMLSEAGLSVGESMIRANRRLKQDVRTGMFVALLYALLNAKERTLTLCSAGQTQPIHLSAKNGKASLVETQGDTFPLGILDDADYEETRLPMETGDKVVFYTDGIVEAMNEHKEMFGFERLLDLIQRSQSLNADDLLKEIVDQVNTFTGSAPQHDDLTVIVVSCRDSV
jgi:serine phosphatase RsbU (regulator of sigma subunit)